MGRKKFFDDIKLGTIYNDCYKALNELREDTDDGYLLAPQLAEITGYKQSQISKALQWGRRQFAEGKISVEQWIMASPKGYFLPKRGGDERTFAYSVHYIKTIRSMVRTQLPLYEYLLSTNPEGLREAFIKCSNGKEDISTEMNPWAVFNQIMENEYITPITNYQDNDDEDWEEYY